MSQVIVFTENNARILYVEDTAPYVDREDALIDPDLSKVQGLAPQHWKKGVGEVLPMGSQECVIRDTHISHYGVVNDIAPAAMRRAQRLRPSWCYLRLHGRPMVLMAVLSGLVVEMLHTCGVL